MNRGQSAMIVLSAKEFEDRKKSQPIEPGGRRGEIIMFPGFDLSWISSALAYWRATGKSYKAKSQSDAEPQSDDDASGKDS